jgi:hypothetical protein
MVCCDVIVYGTKQDNKMTRPRIRTGREQEERHSNCGREMLQ